MGADLVLQDSEKLKKEKMEKEAELAQLQEEINKKVSELEEFEGRMINKELQMDQLRKQAMREGKLDRAKEVRRLREQLEAPNQDSLNRMKQLGCHSDVMGVPGIQKFGSE